MFSRYQTAQNMRLIYVSIYAAFSFALPLTPPYNFCLDSYVFLFRKIFMKLIVLIFRYQFIYSAPLP